MIRLASVILFAMALSINCFAQNPILIDFSGNSAEANGVTLIGAGFGEYPMPDVSFGDIPTDNAFDGATDGRGMIITANPGEGVMMQTPTIEFSNCALLRCSIRLSAPHASLYLASVDQSESTFVSTITPSNPLSFVNQYQRISDFFLPPSTGFQGIIQVINTSDAEVLTVYIDNFEIIEMEQDRINVSIEDLIGSKSPIPDNTPTPTLTPTPANFTGETETVQLGLPEGATELVMVKIPAGTFTMGSPADERGRKDNFEWLPHHVTLTKGFYIGKYEITQAQYQAVLKNNPSFFTRESNYPVNLVSWFNAVDFCNELSKQKGLTPFYNESDWTTDWSADGYRLPTEAEWEYACRAGSQTRFFFGDALEISDSEDVYNKIGDKYMWWKGNNTNNGNKHGPKRVGLKQPNPWNLYDMHGNVLEWCNDVWESSKIRDAIIDPIGNNSGDYRMMKSGCWLNPASYCRSAIRSKSEDKNLSMYVGFRICRTVFAIAPTPTPITTPSPTPTYSGETETIPLDIPEDAKELVMVKIPAGTFIMGSPDNEQDTYNWGWTPHQVTITKDFFMGKYEITQAQWNAVMGTNPSNSYGVGKDYPVYNISWDDCQTFIENLNLKGYGIFRLPTEAEWEYTCRAGTTTAYYWGDSDEESVMKQYCWYDKNADHGYWTNPHAKQEGTQPVGLKSPNAFGLYDASGNVCEYCQDWFGILPSINQKNPKGAKTGDFKVLRGGGWSYLDKHCRSAARFRVIPEDISYSRGFRLCKTP